MAKDTVFDKAPPDLLGFGTRNDLRCTVWKCAPVKLYDSTAHCYPTYSVFGSHGIHFLNFINRGLASGCGSHVLQYNA